MNGLTLYIRTRTKVLDYRFIGNGQPERWWEDGFDNLTDFARPTIIVQADRFLIAGIPSAGRTDSKGAGMHYAIAAVIDSTQDAREAASRSLRHLCEQLGRPGGWRELGQWLDRIDEETWVAAAQGDKAASAKVVETVNGLLAAAMPAQRLSDLPECWIAGEGEVNFRKLGETAAIVVQRRAAGLAAYLNLACEEGLAQLYRECKPIGVICRGKGDFRPKDPAPPGGPKSPSWLPLRSLR